jgi:hypothetical protein
MQMRPSDPASLDVGFDQREPAVFGVGSIVRGKNALLTICFTPAFFAASTTVLVWWVIAMV